MKFSIVTLSFNQAAYLERAMRSVLDQRGVALEYIVVDPGSTDGSRAIIDRCGDRVVRIYEPDQGPGDGLNKGFAAATGDILGYLNADDAYLPGALVEAAAVFAGGGRPDVVCGHGLVVDENDRVLRRFRSAPFGLRRFAFGASVQMQQSTFFRADAFARTLGFNVANRTCWDAELLMELGLAGARFRIVDRYWSVFRVHAASITGSGRLNDRYRDDLTRMFERIMGRPPRPSDAWVGRALRLARWAADPVGLAVRLRDRIGGPPASTRLPAARAGA